MRRFFSDDSYWNTPIGRNPAIDPDSERLTALMAHTVNNGFWLNLDYWTIPVYEVGTETPRHEVRRFLSARNRGIPGWVGSTEPEALHHHLGHTPDFNPVPIPAHAVPSREEDALYGEGCWAQPDRKWDGLLTDNGLMSILLKHYRVPKMENVVAKGMNHPSQGADGAGVIMAPKQGVYC